MLSDKVFQSILPLNDRELCPYEDVLTFGTWSRFFILRSYVISFVVKNSDKIEGLTKLEHSYISTISFCRCRLPGNGARMGVWGLAPGRFFDTTPSRMTENSISL